MKKSIFIAAFILLFVVGWIGSGQFTNVNAEDETTSNLSINENNENTKSEEVKIQDSGNKVEIKEFKFSETKYTHY